MNCQNISIKLTIHFNDVSIKTPEWARDRLRYVFHGQQNYSNLFHVEETQLIVIILILFSGLNDISDR